MRVRRILGAQSPTAEEFVAVVIEQVEATYRLLSAEAHTRKTSPRLTDSAFVGLLETIAGVMRILQNSPTQ
jgi:hypothetical protein